MSHAEQLEQETEQTRAQLADTLDELRACITPGHVLDQLAGRMSDGAAAAFARNLKDQTVNNPLPVALVGAGLAWLMLSGRGSRRGSGERLRKTADNAAGSARSVVDKVGGEASAKTAKWSERASNLGREAGKDLGSATEYARQASSDAAATAEDAAGSVADTARQVAAQAADAVRETAGSTADSTWQTATQAADAVRETAGSMSDSMRRSASAGYEAIADGTQRTASMVSGSTKAARQQMLQSGWAFLNLWREQPVVLAGLGLAVGAVIGALLPKSETEDRLMGDPSDRLKERVQDLASEQYEGAKTAGERVLDVATDEVVKQVSKEEKAGKPKADAGAASGEVDAEGDMLGPSDGQPWTAENGPI